MEALSVRDYRNNLAASFSKADQGEFYRITKANVSDFKSKGLQLHVNFASD
jgi:hypothetical protein